MKKITLLFALILSQLFLSQSKKEEIVGQPFKFTYPTSYLKTYDLNDVASLQIMNAAQEKYTIIIQEEKGSLDAAKIVFNTAEDALNLYSKNIVEGLIDNKLKKTSSPKNFSENGYDFSELSIEGQSEDEETGDKINFFYLFTVIKTKNNFYQVLSWSKLEDRTKYEQEFKEMAKTLKEIPLQ